MHAIPSVVAVVRCVVASVHVFLEQYKTVNSALHKMCAQCGLQIGIKVETSMWRIMLSVYIPFYNNAQCM